MFEEKYVDYLQGRLRRVPFRFVVESKEFGMQHYSIIAIKSLGHIPCDEDIVDRLWMKWNPPTESLFTPRQV